MKGSQSKEPRDERVSHAPSRLHTARRPGTACGTTTRERLCREHSLAPTVVTRWKQECEHNGLLAVVLAERKHASERERGTGSSVLFVDR